MPVQKIMIGYDGSESSERALELAIDLAKQCDAEIHLVFVVNEPTGMMNPIPDEVYQSLVNIGERTLLNAIQQVKKQFLKYITHLETGNSGEKLLELADEIKPDLIIIGAIKHSSSEKLLGTVSSHFLKSRKHPILLVP